MSWSNCVQFVLFVQAGMHVRIKPDCVTLVSLDHNKPITAGFCKHNLTSKTNIWIVFMKLSAVKLELEKPFLFSVLNPFSLEQRQLNSLTEMKDLQRWAASGVLGFIYFYESQSAVFLSLSC